MTNKFTFNPVTGNLNVASADGGGASGPAFRATKSGTSAVPTGSGGLELKPDTIEFDTDNCYSTSTGRFQPTVAGYYYVSASASNGAINWAQLLYLRKNSSESLACGGLPGIGANATILCSVSSLVYLNGTTDYVTATAVHYYGSTINTAASLSFVGCLVRGE